MFCEEGVLRNFTKFTGKHLYQSLFFDKVAVDHLWWLLLNVTILLNQMQPKTKKSFFSISIKSIVIQIRKSANVLSPSQENNMLQISHQNTFYFLRYAHVRYVKSFFNKHSEQQNMLKLGYFLRHLQISRQITQEFLGLRMRNFHVIVFT